MENLKKPNTLDKMDKTNASENSNNGEYGKLKYKYGIRNTLEKAGSSTSTEKALAYTGKNVAVATNKTLPDYKRKRSSYEYDDHHNRKLSRTSTSPLDIHHVIGKVWKTTHFWIEIRTRCQGRR
ncbi:unnamed protein product [Macrosiphum euphorbiae]|uniref:Uncharacterized protein n=1 Tax=Macrosiphum euphorbiae TaxID=13131 RepID=A0AAV0XUA7_9HEMI|nr:unnamed protein product [Macrosiphum euphorbiae]